MKINAEEESGFFIKWLTSQSLYFVANMTPLDTTVVSFLFMVLKTYMLLFYIDFKISTSLIFDEFVHF